MPKHFPEEMIQAAKLGKECFLSDIQPTNPYDCKNCGGMGIFILFIADEGPYLQPANPYRSDGKTSKWYNDRWWVGKSHSFRCPDCKGEGRIVPPPAQIKQAEMGWEKKLEKEMA